MSGTKIKIPANSYIMSKAEILSRIQKSKPQLVALPEIPSFKSKDQDNIINFGLAVRVSGGRCYDLSETNGVEPFLALHFPGVKRIVSMVEEYMGNVVIDHNTTPSSLHHVDVAIIYAKLGVMENGAVWVREEDIGLRILPFIAEHLVVILDKDKIVENMHEAYRTLNVESTGFGVFIAGPSKTADIEQSLVIGAQGARSHAVLLK